MLREPSPEDVELGLLGRPVSAGPWRGEMSDQRLKPPCCETLMGTLLPQMTTTTTPPASHPPLSPSLRPAPLPLGPSRLPPLPLSRWFLRSDPNDRQNQQTVALRQSSASYVSAGAPPLPAPSRVFKGTGSHSFHRSSLCPSNFKLCEGRTGWGWSAHESGRETHRK